MPNGLLKLILPQVLSFVLYGLAVGTFLGILLTRMLAIINEGSQMFYDFFTIGLTSLVYLIATLIILALQGYWIRRKNLANEIVDM